MTIIGGTADDRAAIHGRLDAAFVPENVVNAVVASVETDQNGAEERRREQLTGLKQRLAALRTRMDQMYEDKLDGKIDQEFWSRKMGEWRTQERALESAVESLNVPIPADRPLSARRILELANKAHFLYLTRNSAERGRLLKSVLLNCATDGASLWPRYRKPFDLIFQRAKNEVGRGERI